MEPNSPFNKDVPIIGQPVVLNIVAVALMQCNCEKKTMLMGPISGAPFQCPACKKAWLLNAEMNIAVQQVVLPEQPLITN